MEKYKKGQPYLNYCRWSQITREERYFCQFLFRELNEDGKIKVFLSALRDADVLDWFSPVRGKALERKIVERTEKIYRKSESDWPEIEGSWEVAYEAAFYRDLIYHCEGTGLTKKLVKRYSQLSKMTDPTSIKKALSKRTFDLCLFGPKDFVIVEAKADGTFEGKQLNTFEWDKELLKIWFEHLKLKDPPNIRIFGLVSSRYPMTTEPPAHDFTQMNIFDCVFAWRYLASTIGKKVFSTKAIDAFIRADETYKRERLSELGK